MCMLHLFEITNLRHPRSCYPAHFISHATVLFHKLLIMLSVFMAMTQQDFCSYADKIFSLDININKLI